MNQYLYHVVLGIVLAPLAGSLIAGLFRNQIGRLGAQYATILGVFISFALSLFVAKAIWLDGISPKDFLGYIWMSGNTIFPFTFKVGFLIDRLSALMMVVVTFVSLLVHIYSIGYMADDDGYQRFFSYISLFTFAMLMLVTADNFLQLFFGWEGVGLVSYLLIGFWFKKESAIQGNLKAFLVNRVGDFGFILGIAVIFTYVGNLDYAAVFSHATELAADKISLFSGTSWSVVTVICILLFVGAMGKSAQVPLHVWLPESMEGPTPISALIHAATMVTAGVFMVARMSPLYELSQTALTLVIVIGATGALFTGLLAIVMNDIKRVVAYSTLSQLGYMMVAMGASAYSAGIFHLATHACFKALLFLGAGSVIMAMHHEQDMRKMGGLWKRMPITYICFLIGTLALCAIPPFAGFYSKDTIIEAAQLSTIPGASYAYYCVLIGAFVTALYSFRAFFLTFHGKPRMDHHTFEHVHETPWVVWVPLVLLAIPSVLLGAFLISPMLYDTHTVLGNSVTVLSQHNVLAEMKHEFHGALAMIPHALLTVTFWLVIAGIFVAWLAYIKMPNLPGWFAQRFSLLYRVFVDKYGFDALNQMVFVKGTKNFGNALFKIGDRKIIDGFFVNGSGISVRWIALRARLAESGYLYHYVTAMILGLLIFLFIMLTSGVID
ncbi:MAG: NADH-quinone oxidoreductase subunit L [Proteobacteria bacterium]|nr:NADH-quinone oxidoreductase subunit L [Pseudomonadota bacterium]